MVPKGSGSQSMRPIKVRSSRHRRTIMSPVEAAGSVLDVVEAGGLAVVPLDVSYAFLAGALEPLRRIYQLKLRPATRLDDVGLFADSTSPDSSSVTTSSSPWIRRRPCRPGRDP